jgi:predicted DNA-binding transcriptional regulator AlpA
VKPPREALDRLRDPRTTTLDAAEVASLLGISKAHCYDTIAQTGALAGLPVIRVGKRIKVPAASVRALLGIAQDRPFDDAASPGHASPNGAVS